MDRTANIDVPEKNKIRHQKGLQKRNRIVSQFLRNLIKAFKK